MLLYKDRNDQYLAVPPSLRFAAVNGYRRCFNGRDVPDVICAAFIRESGGIMLGTPGIGT